MVTVDRRQFFALSGALAWAGAAAGEERSSSVRLTPPPLPGRLPNSWTAAEVMPLWPAEPPGGVSYTPQTLPESWSPVFLRNVGMPDLHVFRPAHSNGQALLVIPGGAYQFVSVANEGAEVAARMNALGITVFVLTYRLPGEGWASRADVPLQDAQRAMRIIRSQASRLHIEADTLSVVGFSAGGHLATTLATGYEEQVYAQVDAADRLSARPFAAGLIYPVVTMMKPWTHAQSRNLLLGETPSDTDVARRSGELRVNAETPPLFVVHAMDDEAVPVENSLRLLEATRAAGRPIEAHLLQEGGHAFGVGYPHSPSGHWIELFAVWMERLRVSSHSFA